MIVLNDADKKTDPVNQPFELYKNIRKNNKKRKSRKENQTEKIKKKSKKKDEIKKIKRKFEYRPIFPKREKSRGISIGKRN